MDSVKRILPCLFAVALLGAACGGDSPNENGAASSAEGSDASSTSDGDANASSGTDEAPTDEGQEPTAGPASDGAGGDWPLSFSGELVDGSQFDSGDYAGQDLVLWFWAPW